LIQRLRHHGYRSDKPTLPFFKITLKDENLNVISAASLLYCDSHAILTYSRDREATKGPAPKIDFVEFPALIHNFGNAATRSATFEKGFYDLGQVPD